MVKKISWSLRGHGLRAHRLLRVNGDTNTVLSIFTGSQKVYFWWFHFAVNCGLVDSPKKYQINIGEDYA